MEKKFYKRPIFWLLLFFVVFGFYKNASINGFQNKTIYSDGRGYYAYLPAYFIYDDPSFKSSMNSEYKQIGSEIRSQYYIFKNQEGKYFNKYFPGVAVMQFPFFAGASVITYIAGKPITGYSNTFSNFFYLGHLIYSILGILIFLSCLRQIYPNAKNLEWIVILSIIATPLFYYMLEIPLSHSYTFFLFGLFTWLILKLRNNFTLMKVFWLGLTLGLITITRPTNIMVVLAIPLILSNSKDTVLFFKHVFSRKLVFLFIGILGFISMILVLLILLKWQSGEWFFWPYNGEGFNWTSPMIWQSLVSFRAGIVMQSPIILISFLAVILFFRSKRFEVIWWLIYFTINLFIISAWWCWDYASLFGSRPFTELFFFLLFPIVWLMQTYKKPAFVALGLVAMLGTLRYFQVTSGYMSDQRFTKLNYVQSLAFWKSTNFDRWAFTEACKPFGEKIKSDVLLVENKEVSIGANDVFAFTCEKEIGLNRLDSRLFVTVKLEKKMEFVPMTDVLITIDAFNTETNARCYLTQPLYNDRFEANRTWKELVFSEFVQDNFSECNRIKIYIWNKGQNTFKIRNFFAVLDEYKVL